MSECDNQSVCSDSYSDFEQLDGNVSISSDSARPDMVKPTKKPDKISTALSLPIVATYNCRSLFPKIESLHTDLLERNIDCGFLSEVWEQTHNSEHQIEIEKL